MTQALAARAYRGAVRLLLDDATQAFLDHAADDLQRFIGRSGWVVGLQAEGALGRTSILATVRVAGHDIDIKGDGNTLIEAYSSLIQAVPELVLAAAFRSYLDPRPSSRSSQGATTGR